MKKHLKKNVKETRVKMIHGLSYNCGAGIGRTQVCKTVPGSYFLNGPENTHGEPTPFSARMFQFFTFVFVL